VRPDSPWVDVIEEVPREGSPHTPSLWGMLALAAVVALISTGASARSASVGSASPITNPAAIQKLAAKAYVWGLAPEFVYRFLKFNTLATAPLNTLGGGNAAAAWNNNATKRR
jgi:hypothetical protein